MSMNPNYDYDNYKDICEEVVAAADYWSSKHYEDKTKKTLNDEKQAIRALKRVEKHAKALSKALDDIRLTT